MQVPFEDAAVFAAWAGKALPTEAEWELAARGGLVEAQFCWGDEFNPDGRWMANTWQGQFPFRNLALDGFAGRAPVGSFPPNGYGLYDRRIQWQNLTFGELGPHQFLHFPQPARISVGDVVVLRPVVADVVELHLVGVGKDWAAVRQNSKTAISVHSPIRWRWSGSVASRRRTPSFTCACERWNGLLSP